MDLTTINELIEEAKKAIESVNNKDELNEIKGIYLSKKSKISDLLVSLKDLTGEERSKAGQAINAAKNSIAEFFAIKQKDIEMNEINLKLQNESIDITLPGAMLNVGGKNPFYKIIDEIVDIFVSMGFSVAEGNEVESDHYNFELLNLPKDHPARDMQDTFYINPNTLLRTHTSPVQAHTLEKNPNEPLKIICPGKTYRRDDDDATHSHQFAQVEGLVVGKNINLANLKATLELFIKKMYGEKRTIRLRSSFFPFTEPSVEIDISCSECGGKGCSVCKGTGYIEILGAGMVHPNVLKMNGYDPEIFSGFAFGIGIERVAMLRYGIDDIRKFYQNDIKFLNQFDKRK
ncbi:MAG: phenylalanine--tRNA ligase subunit alpha [Bacilli bacterium]